MTSPVARLRTLVALCALAVPAACGGNGTSVPRFPAGPAPAGSTATPAGSTLIATSLPSSSPTATATATSTGTVMPGTAPSALDLSCDGAPYPSAQWTSCQATNYAMVSESTTEQNANPAFGVAEQSQSSANLASWTARETADPSWLAPQSGNTPQTPACTLWGLPCVGDPFRYDDSAGPDGTSFYKTEASVIPFVFYDDGCARISGRVWAPRSAGPGSQLPTVVIENGSVEAPETLYWWAAQALVREGYVVMTFDPRGQGRSDMQTPSGVQGGNLNASVFWTGLVDAIDFFHSTPAKPYPWNVTCANTYPTIVANYNPFWNFIDDARLGIAGHSAGAIGVSIVQGYGAPGAAAWPGKIDAANPVDVAVAWDGLLSPAGGNVGGIGSMSLGNYPKFGARVPAMGNSSEYGLTPTIFTSPPPIELHKDGYKGWVAAATPVYEITIRGSSHYEWSLLPTFPATSWCPNPGSNACTGGWGNPMAEHYTVAWFDRWLKKPGELGYADADARLLDDNGVQGRNKMSFYFHSARAYPDRGGAAHHCEDIRTGCADSALTLRRRF